MDESLVQKTSFEFALTMIRLYKKLQARQEFILSSQLLKSGTRIGATLEETLGLWTTSPDLQLAQTVYSNLLTAAKQARETRYWLKLLQESRLADVDVTPEIRQIDELIGLLDQLLQTQPWSQPLQIDTDDTSAPPEPG